MTTEARAGAGTVSCVIPAYNEEDRIGGVLAAVVGHPLVSEVIVVDDGSTDATADVVAGIAGVTLLRLDRNRGKSGALCIGIDAAASPLILLVDADLVGLTPDHVTALIEPVLGARADISISLRENATWLWRWIGLDYISGERVFHKALLEHHLHEIEALPKFGFEVFLNDLCIKQRARIAVVAWYGVASPTKATKYGFWSGLWSDVRMVGDIATSIAPRRLARQVPAMCRQRVAPRPPAGAYAVATPVAISFIIPAYNEEARIGACLESVIRALAATGVAAEVIVVNNASTDRTRERASAFPGVRVVDEPVKGLVRARRAGFLAARGALIANIDADTMLTDGWLDVVLREFARDPGLVALSGPYVYYDMPAVSRLFVRIFYLGGYLLHLFNQHILHVGAMIQGGNFVARRTALEAAGGFDTSIAFYGEDTDIARRLSKVGRVKWTFRLPIRSSGRRLMHEGVVRTGLRYALNFFWVTFFGRPWTTTYTDIRSK